MHRGDDFRGSRRHTRKRTPSPPPIPARRFQAVNNNNHNANNYTGSNSSATFSGSSHVVSIRGFPVETSNEDLFDFFIGACKRIQGISRVSGTCLKMDLFDNEGVIAALSLDNTTFRNRRLEVYSSSASSANSFFHPFIPSRERKSTNCQTLFVGNIPERTTEDELRRFFGDLGILSVSMRKGGFKGMLFSHMKFESVEACEKATTLAGNYLNGSRLRLDWAQDKNPQPPAGSSSQTSSPSIPNISPQFEDLKGKTPRIFIGNLTDDISEEDVGGFFSKYGRIISLRLHFDKRTGNRSFGYLAFPTNDCADLAVSDSKNAMIKGINIRVDYARQDRGMSNPITLNSTSSSLSRGTLPQGQNPQTSSHLQLQLLSQVSSFSGHSSSSQKSLAPHNVLQYDDCKRVTSVSFELPAGYDDDGLKTVGSKDH